MVSLGSKPRITGVAVTWREVFRYSLPALITIFLGLTSFAIQQIPRASGLFELAGNFVEVKAEFEILDSPKVIGTDFKSYRSAVKIIRYQAVGAESNWVPSSLIGQIILAESKPWQIRGAVVSCTLNTKPAPAGTRYGFLAKCVKPQLIRAAPEANVLIQNIRNSFIQALRGVSQDSIGLVAGLAIGDTSMISKSLSNDMQSVSLTHLTAVSGANCAIVVGSVFILLKKLFPNRGFVCLVSGLVLGVYVLIVGPEPSVLRAATMAGAVLFGMSLGRKSAPLISLALSVCILLVADPWLATSFGFALSVGATLGILVLTGELDSKFRGFLPGWLALAVSLALSAQLFCLPVLLQLQPGLSTYAIPANVLAGPLVAPITVLAMAACAVAWLLPWLASALTWLASLLASLIVLISRELALAPAQTVSWPSGLLGVLTALTLIFSLLIYLRAKRHRLRLLGAALSLCLVAILAGSFGHKLHLQAAWAKSPWQVVACDVGQGDGLVIRSAGFTAVVDVGKTDRLIDDCLDSLGIQSIDLLVLTHFDFDHVGGLKGAIGGRRVASALVSPFKDERFAAVDSREQLSAIGAEIIIAEAGLNGSLGQITWRVLNPPRNAVDTEDSNDASIAMLFSAENFYLLSLADLGEKAQMRLGRDAGSWLGHGLYDRPLILKVAHHGSADQFAELHETLRPDLAIISVGSENSYGHPTKRTMELIKRTGAEALRTDESGSIAIWATNEGLAYSLAGRLD